MKNMDIALIGGDKRTAYMARFFSDKGYKVICFDTVNIGNIQTPKENLYTAKSLRQAIEKTPVIICGIPLSFEGNLNLNNYKTPIALGELQRCLRKKQVLFAGMIPPDFSQKCNERQIGCHDFLSDENLTLYQAIATAEGAIAETLLHTEKLLHRSHVLVLGYGRCGKALATKLSGLNCQVSICCRREEQLSLAESLGFATLPLSSLEDEISCFDFIYNTVPVCLLDRKLLGLANPNVCIIDIASKRIGVDYEYCMDHRINAIYCPHLPGKYAPESCGRRMGEFILRQLNATKDALSDQNYMERNTAPWT